MMSNKDQNMGDLREAVEPVLRVLSQLGGHFTFTSQQGEQFVIARKTDFEALKKERREEEKQLPMSLARREQADTLEDVLGRINEEIAVYQSKQQEQELDDLEFEAEENIDYSVSMPPPVRLRFEPIRGDLPPELQE